MKIVFLILLHILSVIRCEDEPYHTVQNTASKAPKKADLYNENVFTFNLFENFELAREVYLSELKLIDHLLNVRSVLQEKYDHLTSNRLWKGSLSVPQNLTFGDGNDFHGAVKGLVFLHDTYSFDLNQFAKGVILVKNYPKGRLKIPHGHPLAFDDFRRLAKQAFALKFYDRAIEFMRMVLKLLPEQHGLSKTEVEAIHKIKRDLITLNNQNLYQSGQTIHSNFKILPYIVTDNLKRKKTQPDFVQNDDLIHLNGFGRFERDAHFRRVCNGQMSQRNPLEPQKCHFLHHHNPYLRLGPFKIEVASKAPLIMVFHDFLTKSELEFLIEYSRPRLSRGRFYNPYNQALDAGLNEGKKVTRIVQKSVQCWIGDLEYQTYHDNLDEFERDFNYTIHFPNLFRLTQRMELATGLNTTAKYATTEYQTTNYGLGGLCETHYDPHGYIEGVQLPPHPKFKRYLKWGDMMATVMGWLEDVEAGGATGFTDPGNEVLIWPRKGSVAFWFGLDRKGHRDKRLLHGGCPILKGSKWILNKWIHYYDQFNKVPCSLNPDDVVLPFEGIY